MKFYIVKYRIDKTGEQILTHSCYGETVLNACTRAQAQLEGVWGKYSGIEILSVTLDVLTK